MGSSATSVLAAMAGIDSWTQSSQLANYWRRYSHIPEMPMDGNWYPSHHEDPESPASVTGSGMEDTESMVANVDITPPPVQIQQLANLLLEHSQQ